MFTDSHAHLTYGETFDHLPAILERARAAGVDHIVNICTDKETLERGIDLAQEHPWIVNAGATTPHDVEEEGELYFSAFESAALEGKLAAVGETGLDYYYEHSDRALQQQFLIRYLHLAKKAKLPVVIHCRHAFEDLFAITKKEYPLETLVLHCFTGTYEEAKVALERGWLISISGIATFKRSEELRETIKKIPLSSLVIETDTPYLAPQSRRGKPCEPAYVVETCQLVAELKGVSLEEAARITTENATNFFF